MIIRRANERGHADHGWLDSWHTFSFADYEDEAWMGFRSLRVINEDRIMGGQGFGFHGHRDMEIITYVMEGALAHEDSMGNKEVLRAGEFQRMSAGTGVMHSEVNASETDTLHLYQIWIMPNRRNLPPGYEQKEFRSRLEKEKKILIASPDARDGSLKIHQDAEIWLWRLGAGETASLVVPAQAGTQKAFWVQVVSGEVKIAGETLTTSDAAAFDVSADVVALKDSEVMIFILR
jgi:redox-sensitive bicupin YhaK (pirin superfamily)